MKLTGEEDASLCVEENEKPYLTISQLNWHQLLNNFICEKVWDKSEKDESIEKFDTKFITINNLKIPKEVLIKAVFEVSTKATPETILDNKCEISVKVKDFYNCITELFVSLSKKYNTTIWNISLNMTELILIDGKPITKVKIQSSDDSNFLDYIDVIKKYSMDEVSLKKDNEYGYYYIDIEINSLEFIPNLYDDILKIGVPINGLIFNIIEDWYYKLEIYDGYIE